MAQTSYPFDAQSVNESQYSAYFRELQDNGVIGSSDTSTLKVTSAGTNMTLSVAIGAAIVRGHFYNNDAIASLTIAAADTAARTDRVVLRLDPAANSIVLAVIKGTAGGGTPALTQTDTGIYELCLANVAVGASVTSISAASVTDQRRWVGSRIGSWSTALRPTTPRVGRLGFNTDTLAWEFWNGTAWTALAPTVDWNTIQGKPATFPPSTHTHPAPAWADVTGKPSAFNPSAHLHEWNDLTNVPATFAPSTHSHSWSSITSKPTTFAPSSHSHNYMEYGDTIYRANGSDRPHSYGPTGSTWYAVWVDGNHNFCRNTSSIKFKENVRDIEIRPEDVLALRPRVYDRKPTLSEDGKPLERRVDEFGLIAEEVAETLPQVVNYLDGEVDGLRYDLLGVALIPVVQDQQARIESLEEKVTRLEKLVEGLAS
ncbi:tail protein [Streptomyces phage Endor2]|uniref:Minor tail protein n=1 Tax=Streptomyces phage Endor2 TaxID=2740182 RepID=A0A7G4AX30_9CAUD|nr:tail protein [Streptomyces phage Endor2]QMP84570.1 minor tail protein [Streptomyces phage Endor2]